MPKKICNNEASDRNILDFCYSKNEGQLDDRIL